MPKTRTNEDVELINTFLSVNTTNPKANDNSGNKYLKTITARVFGNSKSSASYLIDGEENGYLSLSDVFDVENGKIVQERINEFRTMSMSRYRQYATYDEMANDTIISSALDMYADDATQTDASGERIWIQADEEKNEVLVSNIFEGLNIKDKIWKIARSLAHYGDVYLELIYDNKPTSEVTLLESLERQKPEYTRDIREVDKLVHKKSEGYVINDIRIVPDVENVFDLQINGTTVAFAKLAEVDNYLNNMNGYYSPKTSASDIKYYPPDKFVHIYLDQSDRRDIEYFVVDLDNGKQFKFEIARGKSMIHDIFRVYRDLQLLEYSIMLNRASRSSIFRFVKVEVGNMSKSNVDVTLRKVKNLIESKTTLNTNDQTFKPYTDPGPVENYIYIPVRDGQGNITVDTVGGDVNIRDIADLEYYQDKLFAGLKIPKSFLNYSDTGTALFNSGGALTKQDARYARTVKRLQSFIISGITRLLNIILDNRGLAYLINDFEVRMVIPSTVEDEERNTAFNNKIELVKSITDAVSALTADNENVELDMEKYIEYLSDDILDEPMLKEFLIVKNDEPVDGVEEAGGGGFEPVEDDFGGGGGGISEPDFSEPPTTSTTTSEPEINTNDFGGEWEDLEV